MDFGFTREQEELRKEVREFLEEEIAAGTFSPHVGTPIAGSHLLSEGALTSGRSMEFSRKMAKRNWIGFTWPKKYGGQERSYVDKMILNEELFKVRAPVGYHFAADRQVGPALIMHGTEWQREYFLNKIINAEDGVGFCLLFSEPGAGSDLGAVKTTAVRDGEYYILNGQKIWTSGGHTADYGWCLARSIFDDSIPKGSSCTEFMVDMKLPGVDIRPIINSAGVHSFNEVFLDNVRVHEKFRVGKDGAGFAQIMSQMNYERAGIERLLQTYAVYKQLVDYVKQMDKTTSAYQLARNAVAQAEIEQEAGRLLCYHTAWNVDQGTLSASGASLCKAFCTQFDHRLTDLASVIVGSRSQIKKGSQWSPFEGDLASYYLWAPSMTLQGGSVEVLKNIIAQRGLGLPRR